ncbi:transmembrane protein 116 isoform X2 [Scleropages formosus]|uniref:transmembrane protein 116 isoform X2 n=1 Tax=Scleropages formosus TaxID=113540 RepID=UPI00087895B8|nr:transmembrane protein 116 isoform X2 [Scleropages formosus]
MVMETLLSDRDNEQNITSLPLEDWTNVYEAVRWIQQIVAILSILGSGSIIFYAAFQNLIRTSEVRPLFFLSVTDMLLSLSWLVGAVLFTQSCSSPGACYNLHIIEQIFYMSSFFYTLNYVWVLHRSLKRTYYRRLNSYPSQFPEMTSLFGCIAIVLSCVFPLLLMVPVLAVGNSDQCYTNFSQPYKCLLMHRGALYPTSRYRNELTSCHMVHVYGIAVFLATFLFTFMGIVVLMGKAHSLYKRCVDSSGYFGDRQWAALSVLERRMVLYPSAFFFCWSPGIHFSLPGTAQLLGL